MFLMADHCSVLGQMYAVTVTKYGTMYTSNIIYAPCQLVLGLREGISHFVQGVQLPATLPSPSPRKIQPCLTLIISCR